VIKLSTVVRLLFLLLAASCLTAPLVVSQIGSAASPAGNIEGRVGISLEGDHYYLTGWACQQGVDRSIRLHVYGDHSAYNKPPGTMILSGTADLESEPAIDRLCHCSARGKHRFEIALPEKLLAIDGGRSIFVHGIRLIDGVTNAVIGGSDDILFPCLPLSGRYKGSQKHPRVFNTEADLREMASRINLSGTYSAQMFKQLGEEVRSDLKAKDNWDAAYSGTDIDVYLRTFSYESRGGYASEVRSERQLSAALHLQPGETAPHGAAIIAARAALYAALIKAGAPVSPGAVSKDQAALLAKRVLLSWARSGFRQNNGKFMTSATQFSGNGKFDEESFSAVALQVSRGVIYSVCAQDLLAFATPLSPREEADCDAFHTAMFDLIVAAEKRKRLGTCLPCNAFGNHTANGLAGLLAIARLLDDEKKFYAILYGGDRSAPVPLPWTTFFNRTIYGQHDQPNGCYPNTGLDCFSSRPFFQTAKVVPGEIDDRFRNENAEQGIGYPMFTLERLYNAADILEKAGLDGYGYRGAHQESIELATQYYATYAQHAGFNQVITSENAGTCPNSAQYLGKKATGEANFIEGAYRFPDNHMIVSVEDAAKLSPHGPVDPLRFGRWRN
jgi:hypothetical protein